METYPTTGVADIASLLGRFVAAFLRGPRSMDAGSVLNEWMRHLTRRYESDNVIINFFGRKVLLVSGRSLSHHIMKDPPSSGRYIESALKRNGMSFLAPDALVISHDAKWERLRGFNEKVLDTGTPHTFQQDFLDRVREAFAEPVSTVDDIRQRMGQVMLGINFGKSAAPETMVEDIQVLFGLVGSPLKRRFSGKKEAGRKSRFYDSLRQLWTESRTAERPSLLFKAQKMSSAGNEEELLQQIPHWMFTFTGSGTDLLARTLTMIASRPEVRARVLQEIERAGPLDAAASIQNLDYLEACLLETGRLFAPVSRTFHQSKEGDVFEGKAIPAKMEIAHFFPLTQRDASSDSRADDFWPDRWLDPAGKAHEDYPNLFLGGARACPGRDLILFVCKSALALLLTDHGLTVSGGGVLSRDPVPFSIPQKEMRFSR